MAAKEPRRDGAGRSRRRSRRGGEGGHQTSWLRSNGVYLILAAVGVLALSYLVVVVRGVVTGDESEVSSASASDPSATASGATATHDPEATASDMPAGADAEATEGAPPESGGSGEGDPSPDSPPSPAGPAPPATGFPNATNTGVPAGWQPRETRNSWRITQSGVYEDVRVNGGDISIAAANVTLRRVELVGGRINIENCRPGIVIEDASFLSGGRGPGGSTEGAIGPGGYTARRIKIQNLIEGLRSGGCGPVIVEDSYLHINDGGDCDLHADGIQGYNGSGLVLHNVAIDARDMECGTAPVFYPKGQGNEAPVEFDRVWLAGGGYSLRVGVGPATLNRVYVLDDSWAYGPVSVDCRVIAVWDVSIVDSSGKVLRRANCTGEGN